MSSNPVYLLFLMLICYFGNVKKNPIKLNIYLTVSSALVFFINFSV